MDTRITLAFLALAACGSPRTEPARITLLDECCACPDAGVDAAPDAPLDAPPDAPGPPPIDLALPWTRAVITPSSPTLRGADGAAPDGQCIVTPWEQSNTITRACPVGETWVTEVIATNLSAVEDAKAADIDGDGLSDIAWARDTTSVGGVGVTFRGTPHVTDEVPASMGHGRANTVAIADVSGDGLLDVVFGTRVGAPAVVAWLENPGALARTGSAWPYREVSKAGWVMTIEPVAIAGAVWLVVADRGSYKDAGGVVRWDLYGARAMEPLAGGAWAAHPIGHPAGSCSPYTNPACQRTPGDQMMLSAVSLTAGGELDYVLDGQSAASQPDSRVMLHSFATGTHTLIAPVASVGHFQHAIMYDVDLDADVDIVVSSWKGNAFPVAPAEAGKSGVYWLRNEEGGTWTRGEVSGPEGGKFDNLLLRGRCVVTTEQIDPVNGLGAVMYCPPGA